MDVRDGLNFKDRLLRVFREEFKDSALDERVNAETYAAWDSLAHIRLLIAIEREFSFEPTAEEIAETYSDFPTLLQVIVRAAARR